MHSSYRDLLSWQKAMDLVDSVYSNVRAFPRYEMFGLTAQMRSAASSVPANIAEGQGRHSFREFRQFLRRARASLMELETHIEIARRQRFLTQDNARGLLEESMRVVQLINGLIRHISIRLANGERQTANGKPTVPAP